MESSALLSTSELSQMKSLLIKDEESLSKKQSLKQKSESRYKNWGNTLEAQREKKEKDRLERLAAIEAAQQEIDRKEASFKEDQRKRAIDRAQRLLYSDTERAKELQSSVILARVLQERQAQIQRKQKYQQVDQMVDEYHLRQVEDAMKKMEAREKKRSRFCKTKCVNISTNTKATTSHLSRSPAANARRRYD